jgi:hypothetical protein
MPDDLGGSVAAVDAPAAVGNSSEGFSPNDDMSALEGALSAHYAAAPEGAAVAALNVPDAPAADAPVADAEIPEDEFAPVADATPKVEDQQAAPAAETQPQVASQEAPEGGLSIGQLNKALASTPELKAIFDKNPQLRAQFFYNARQAERSAKYDELFQTPAMAQEVKRAAESEFQFNDLFEKEPIKALENLRARSFERNEDGSLKINPETGLPVDNGSYDRAMGAYRNAWYGAIESGVQQLAASGRSLADPSGGPAISHADLQEALRILQIATEGSSKLPAPNFGTSAPASVPGQQQQPQAAAQRAALPPEVQAQLAELEKIKASQKANEGQSFDTFKTSIEDQSNTAIETDVRNLLAKRLPANAGFSDYMKDKIVSDTVAEVKKVAAANAAHQSVVARLTRSVNKDAAGIQKVVAQRQSFAREIIGRKLADVLSRATPGVVAQNRQTQQKVQAQVARREVQSSGGVSTPSRQDVRQVARDIDSNARKAGKPLSDLDFVDAVVASQQRQ